MEIDIVVDAVADCFAAISRLEQQMHVDARAEASKTPPSAPGQDATDDFLAEIDKVLVQIHAEVDQVVVDEQLWRDVAGLSPDRLRDVLAGFAASGNADLPLTRQLAHLIVQAELLDHWFEPVGNRDMPMSSEQVWFRDAFEIDGHLRLPDGGILLPRYRESWRSEDEGGSWGIFAQRLRNVTYIPQQLACDDPDNLTSPGQAIATSYTLWASPGLAANPLPKDPKVAIAPLAERGGDVTFVPSDCRSRYSLKLNYDETRFAAALDRAIEQDVHILLLPEMVLPEGNPADFDQRMREIIVDAQERHHTRTGKATALRMVVAGVLGGTRADGWHSNYAVVFDMNGEQPANFQQLKLSHWNLTKGEQDRFGVTHYHGPQGLLKDPVIENSRPAEQLGILEIPGIGRTAIFICADMSQNNPGDWLSMNAALDWLYAPIMDKSTCWQISDTQQSPRPWIVRRTHRSARLTGTLVITANSMALSRWVNEGNRISGSSWPAYTEIGIGLAVDGRRDGCPHDHVTVPVDALNVIGTFTQPVEKWKCFPSPP